MSFIIHCQRHIFPAEYAELLTRNTGSLSTSGGDGTYLIDYDGVQRFKLELEAYSPRRKLRAMDEAGVDMSVISVNIPTPDMLDDELAVAGARICNEAIAELCQRHPRRFLGIASLPLNDIGAASSELERAANELDLRGIFLPSHVNGIPVDDSRFLPIYARAAELGLPLVLHPTVPAWGAAIGDYSMLPMIGFMVDTSYAMLRLILSGIMESLPALKVVHPHCGGVLPYVMGRVIEQTEVKRRGRERIQQSPRETYRRVYLDLVSPDAQAIDYAYRFAGASQLLFGSDHPWVSIEAIMSCLRQLQCGEDDMAAILAGNARQLFGIS